MTEENKSKLDNFVLVLSVGGSMEPLIESINHYQASYVVFVASKDSNEKIVEILRQTKSVKKHETITLTDFQNMLDCVRDIRENLALKLEAMNLPVNIPIIADITGGTKIMSAALTLAMMEYNSRFTYVGGDKRTKDGLGIVESGHEKIIRMENPWDVIGLREARNLVQSFNAGDFATAMRNAEIMRGKDTEYSAFYEGLGILVKAFNNWDVFNYQLAKKLFEQGLGRVRAYNNRRHKEFCGLFQTLQLKYAELAKIAADAEILRLPFKPLEEGVGSSYLVDLVGNASRRAARGHYDDAVARLYSAVEKTVKIALARHGINNSTMPKELVCGVDEYFADKYANGTEEVKLPLTDSFLFLCAAFPQDPLANAYLAHREQLAKGLESRNMSLLAHGYNPVGNQEYQKLFKIVCQFLDISEAALPEFPHLELKSIIF